MRYLPNIFIVFSLIFLAGCLKSEPTSSSEVPDDSRLAAIEVAKKYVGEMQEFAGENVAVDVVSELKTDCSDCYIFELALAEENKGHNSDATVNISVNNGQVKDVIYSRQSI